MNTTTSSTIDLSREQLLKILTTVGLLDEYGIMYSTNEAFIFEDKNEFELVPFNDYNEVLTFALDGASADGSTLILQTPHGSLERFEVLATSQVNDLLK
jgi:hypothetical protein